MISYYFKYIFQDYANNKKNIKILIVLTLFRIASLLGNGNKFVFFISIPFLVCYRVFVEWFLSIELHWKLKIGPACTIHHGFGLVVNPRAKIGKGCILRHMTTIGAKGTPNCDGNDAPVIEDFVDIGPHVVILGPIIIGANSVIGAGSVVVKDVPPHAIVAGNPAKVIGRSI